MAGMQCASVTSVKSDCGKTWCLSLGSENVYVLDKGIFTSEVCLDCRGAV